MIKLQERTESLSLLLKYLMARCQYNLRQGNIEHCVTETSQTDPNQVHARAC